MKANELRIGNIVEYNGMDKEIVDIDYRGFLCFSTDEVIVGGYKYTKSPSVNIKNFEPIPISEEWLLKLGFDKRRYSMGHAYYFLRVKDYHSTISAIEFNGKVRVSIVNQSVCTVTNVHSLQNLIYSITGNELKITI